MNAFEVYVDFLALHKHFNTKYDYFRYNGVVSTTVEKFNQRKDKPYFVKLSNHYSPHNWLLANFISGTLNYSYIGDTYKGDGDKIYESWAKANQSLTYHFTNELDKLDFPFNDNFVVRGSSHPKLLKMYLGEKISLYALTILMDITDCEPYWQSKMSEDVTWKSTKNFLKKYKPFLDYDRRKFTAITKEFFAEAVA